MKQIKSKKEFEEVLKELLKGKDGIIMFTAEGCPYCKEAREKMHDRDDIYDVVINEDTIDIVKSLQITSTPTIMVVKDKKIVRKVIGYADTVTEYIEKILRGEL